jgi:PST family polysaccharide transporter
MNSDPRSHLETVHLQEDLRSRSISGAFITLTTQSARFALQIASLWVLAHVLTPGDFGLYGMVVAVTGFILLFKDLGLSTATVQRAEVSHEQVSTLFWVNIALSVLIMAITMSIAPLISRFYDEPRLTAITLALACTFLLGGVTVQHLALLTRQMRFRALAVIEISGHAAGVAAALTAAFLGAGYWALVIQQAAGSLVMTAGVWIACDWRPRLPVLGSGIRPMLCFGGNLTVFGVVNYLARNLDNVLIGRVWGAESLGLYTRAYALLLTPLRQVNAPVAQIAVPGLSRLQDQPARYRRYYLNALRLIAMATMPPIALAFVLSREIVYLVLGPQWTVTGELFLILACAAFLQPVLNTSGWVYVSLGQTGRMARWGGAIALLYCVSFVIGIQWGVRGVALAYTVAVWVLAVPGMQAALSRSSVRLLDFFRTVAPSMTLGLAIAVTGLLVRRWVLPAPAWMVVAACSATAALTALALVAAWPSFRRDVNGLRELLAEIRAGLGS